MEGDGGMVKTQSAAPPLTERSAPAARLSTSTGDAGKGLEGYFKILMQRTAGELRTFL